MQYYEYRVILFQKEMSKMIKCRLKVVLAMNEMTQKELAERTGIRPPTISAMANNSAKHYPSDVLDKICSVLHCNVGDLLEYIPAEEE